ncbi:MAG: cofactor-independent phosphoglycerate mutase [bacterium]
MKYIIFLGDGMADLPVAELGGRTPLEVAVKPTMDAIARDGACGRFITVDDDMPPGSEVANLSVLGYNARICYQGRGVIEAAAMGVPLSDSDVGLRCNLICLDDGRIKNHSAGHIPNGDAHQLVRFLNARLIPGGAKLYPGVSYRHLLVLSSGSADLDCAPPHDHVGERAEDLLVKPRSADAAPTADLLNDLIRRSWKLLADHPLNRTRVREGKDSANSIWPWSPGHRPRMQTFKDLYGLTGAVISAVDLIRGLGVYAGLEVINVPGATGLIDTNYEGKADACLDAIARHDFVFVHVEAPDEAAHSRDVKQKIQAIEFLDERLIKRVVKTIRKQRSDTIIALLPDHITPVEKGNHVHGAVPFAIMGPGFAPDVVQRYDELSVEVGSLGTLRGQEFFHTLIGRRH